MADDDLEDQTSHKGFISSPLIGNIKALNNVTGSSFI